MPHWERQNPERNDEKTGSDSHRQSEGIPWRAHGVGEGLGRVSWGMGRRHSQDAEFEVAKRERRRVFLVEGVPKRKARSWNEKSYPGSNEKSPN